MEDSQEAKRRKGTSCAQTFVQTVHQKSLLKKKKKEAFRTGSNMKLSEQRLAPSPHFVLKYLINLPPK